MATATYVQRGESIDYTPSAAVDAGEIVVLGDVVGVAQAAIAANALGALTIEGVFDFPKASGDGGIAVGVDVFYDTAEGVGKDDSESSANKRIGKCVIAAGDTATTVRVKLLPS